MLTDPNETWASTLENKNRDNIVRLSREFQLKKYADGWACLHWPVHSKSKTQMNAPSDGAPTAWAGWAP